MLCTHINNLTLPPLYRWKHISIVNGYKAVEVLNPADVSFCSDRMALIPHQMCRDQNVSMDPWPPFPLNIYLLEPVFLEQNALGTGGCHIIGFTSKQLCTLWCPVLLVASLHFYCLTHSIVGQSQTVIIVSHIYRPLLIHEYPQKCWSRVLSVYGTLGWFITWSSTLISEKVVVMHKTAQPYWAHLIQSHFCHLGVPCDWSLLHSVAPAKRPSLQCQWSICWKACKRRVKFSIRSNYIPSLPQHR